jgi:hypothetical protein
LILEKSTLSGARPFSDIRFRNSVTTGGASQDAHCIDNKDAENKNAENKNARITGVANINAAHIKKVRLRTAREEDSCGNTRVALTHRRTKPPREGLVGLQFNCQDSSATVTIPGLIPVDTNANLQS